MTMIRRVYETTRSEQGLVSLLTVVFFMIFISLIAVSFTTIVVQDQRQATDNDLSASALAAARGGIEDGKRILIYCKQNPTSPNCTDEVLNSQNNCDLFKSNVRAQALANALKIDINTNGEGITGGANASQYEQYFTCLTIQTKTPSLTATLASDADYIQQLKTVSPFTNLQVSWSPKNKEITFLTRSGPLDGWPKISDWSYAPVLELQVIPYMASSFGDLNSLEAGARTMYVVPCTSLCIPTGGSIALQDKRAAQTGSLREIGAAAVPIIYASCDVRECNANIGGFSGGDPAGTQYYVRVSLLYSDSASVNLELSPFDSSNHTVLFDNVQPRIDSTGRANDVFRRVRAEVTYAQSVSVPRSAVGSAAPICKDMTVTKVASSSTYNCN